MEPSMTDHTPARRDFLKAASAPAGGAFLAGSTGQAARAQGAESVNVVVWDERQPAQKEAYENFLGNRIAEHLKTQPGFRVQSVGIDDPEQGLSATVLDVCDVLIWWG